MNNVIKFISLSIIIVLVFSACSRVSEETMGISDPGVDSLGYKIVMANDYTLKYKVEGANLHCILSAETNGWVAVGFAPTAQMKDANFIIGYVENGSAFINDEFGTSNTTHQSDNSLGGTDNLTNKTGSESGSMTTLEFIIPLNSGDTYDRTLMVGQSYPLIFAKGNGDDFTSMHTSFASATLNLSSTPGGNNGIIPDTTGYNRINSADYLLYWRVDGDSLRCILSAQTQGWVAVGFDPSNQMKDANFIIGYVTANGVSIRDDFGVSNTTHAADISFTGGVDNVRKAAGKEENGKTVIAFTIPLNSGDSYDRTLLATNSYPIIFAKGNTDDFNAMHTGFASATLNLNPTTPDGNTDHPMPDTTGYNRILSNDFDFHWKVVGDSLKCILAATTAGWVAVGFDNGIQMNNANFIIGYVTTGGAFLRDDFGNGTTTHVSDIVLAGSYDIASEAGKEEGGKTIIAFSIPLNSGDINDRVLLPTGSYPIIFAKGSSDDFNAMHTSFASATLNLNPNSGGNNDHTVPDTTGYMRAATLDYLFYWKVVGDSLRCILSAETSGWVAVGFDPTNRMQNADFIIGYVTGTGAFLRDDFGVGTTTHSSDTSLGGSYNLTMEAGKEENGRTIISFTIPLNSGDSYDKNLVPANTYPVIFAKGSQDDFNAMHTSASSIMINFEQGAGETGATQGGDISLDTEALNYTSINVDGYNFQWAIKDDSLRCKMKAPTTGWVAVGFNPTDEMLNANFIIGYVSNGIGYVRDDFGDTQTTHVSDILAGGTNNVTRVFGRDAQGSTELRFTIPLNSQDPKDRPLTLNSTVKLILAHGPNGSDNFSSMHDFVEETTIILH